MRGYVLLKLIEEEKTTSSGLVLPDNSQERQAKGRILEVGLPTYNEASITGVDNPQINKGEIVWFKRFAGEEVTEKGEKIMLVHYKDLLGVYK